MTEMVITEADPAIDPAIVRHEIGHAIVAGLCGHGIETISAKQRGNIGGQVITTPPKYRDSFRVALEMIEIKAGGACLAPLPGQHGDIDEAAKLARAITFSDREADALLRWLVIEERLAAIPEDKIQQLADQLTRAGGEYDFNLSPVRDDRAPLIEVNNTFEAAAPKKVAIRVTRDGDGNATAYEDDGRRIRVTRDAEGNPIRYDED